MLIGRDSPTFPQSLFVTLRRAGWRVSPVLEGAGSDRREIFQAHRHRASVITSGRGSGTLLASRGLQKFMLPPGQTLLTRATLNDLHMIEGAQPAAGDEMLPPLTVQATLRPGVLIVDIGMAQRILKMPEQVSRLLVANGGVKAGSPLAAVAGDRLRFVEAGAENDLQRPDRQLSS